MHGELRKIESVLQLPRKRPMQQRLEQMLGLMFGFALRTPTDLL
jgi:hypothetical protein